jgi:hypothetical protein
MHHRLYFRSPERASFSMPLRWRAHRYFDIVMNVRLGFNRTHYAGLITIEWPLWTRLGCGHGWALDKVG